MQAYVGDTTMPRLVNCENCGKPFYVKPAKLDEFRRGNQHSLCCSYECSYQLRRGRPNLALRRRVTLTCEICGKTFEETAVHAESRRFCSIACKAEYQRTALTGESNPFYGRQHSEETRRKIAATRFYQYGEHNPNWHGGVTELKLLVRKSKRYQQWRDAVYRRDHYRSVQSHKRVQSWELVAHHRKPFIEILDEMLALYPHLSPDKDAAQLCEIAMNYAPLWDINNGMTLLRHEHHELHYGAEPDDEDE